jgi:M6 family metalloprotease-like protein
MKQRFTLQVLFLLGVWWLFLFNPKPDQVPKMDYAPAYPYPIDYQQPDGSKISIINKGDENFSYAITADGYTVLQNEKGFFYYAELNSKKDLIMSKVMVKPANLMTSTEKRFTSSLKKGLFFSKNQIELRKADAKLRLKGSEVQYAFPTTGNRNVLLICIDYPDKNAAITLGTIDNMMNQSNYNGTGSFKDFYFSVSYNQLTLTTTVVGWYRAAQNRAYYGAHNGTAKDDKPRELVQEAILAADAAGINFAPFDNDNDGKVDGVQIIHSGYGEEASSDPDDIWSHRAALGALAVTCDGKTVDDYAIYPELRSNTGTNLTNIGVVCHEFGHSLGLPDYYDTDYETNGQGFDLGKWDIMADGCWNNQGASPAGINVMGKSQMGWITLTELNNPADIINMPNAMQNQIGYKIFSPVANEYFILENRQKVGFDAYIPGNGLLIYHFDGNNWPSMRNKYATHQCYDIEEADGTESTGSFTGDPFPGSTNKTSFTDATVPGMKTWSNENTGKPITNISESGGLISFQLMGGNGQNVSSFNAVPSGATINQSWVRYNLKDVVLAYSETPVFGVPQNGVAYSAGNSIPGGGTVLYAGSNESFSHTNLFGKKTYYYKIWTIQDASPSYSTGWTANAQTGCGKMQLPFFENFDALTAIPDCWATYRGANNEGVIDWAIFNNSAYSKSGTKTIALKYEANDGILKEDWLVSPQLAIPNGSVALEYWERRLNSSNFGGTYSVRISTSSQTDKASFTTFYEYNETKVSTTHTQRTINLSEFAGQNIYIALVYSRTTGGDYWFVDDYSVSQKALAPLAITKAATDVLPQGATLNALVNASNQQSNIIFEYGLTTAYGNTINASPNSVTGLNNTSVSAILGGLMGNTTYHYRVVAANATGISYGDDFTFTTACGPTALPLSKGFEDGVLLSPCWASFNIGSGGTKNWQTFNNASYAHTGSYSVMIASEINTGATEDWFVSPLLALPAQHAVSFEYWERKINPAYNGTFFIKISTTSQTDPAAFTTLINYQESDISASYTKRTVDLSTYSGQNVYIALMTSRPAAQCDYWFVDDISVNATPLLIPTWNGIVWENGLPEPNKDAIINGNYDGPGFPCKNLIINAGKQFTLASGTLDVIGTLYLKSDATATATILNNGVINTSKVIAEQYISGAGGYLPTGKNWYISSPVANAKSSSVLSPATNFLWSFDATNRSWLKITDPETTLPNLTGYIARVGNNGPISFTGTAFNNGNLNIPTLAQDADRFALVGNPYPSYLNWDLVHSASSNLSTTIWYRTKNDVNAYVFDTYNKSGAIGTNNNKQGAVTKFIPPMQAFWVRTNSGTSNIVTNNTMRSHQSGRLLKGESSLIRLTAGNDEATDETVIYLHPQASSELDEYDSPKRMNNTTAVPDFYSIINNSALTINGLNSTTTPTTVSLGFSSLVAGKYTLALNEILGLFKQKNIVLEDKVTGTLHDLKAEPTYTFQALSSDAKNRFVLHISETTTHIQAIDETLNVAVSYTNDVISVVFNEYENQKGTITVFNSLGQKMLGQNLSGQVTEIRPNFSPGIYLIKVNTGAQAISRKIFVN